MNARKKCRNNKTVRKEGNLGDWAADLMNENSIYEDGIMEEYPGHKSVA